ncbi:hypothetical protein VTK73DRAFT_10362 [Phialemonium thermophilum]|uniref:Rhodopsin domain-containing protein n=1 Tax=Phialemonium thermophilum TaxID=223376 RepID=A0ABR3XG65_9PEZI
MASTGQHVSGSDSRGGSVIAAAISTVCIAAIFVTLRFITRAVIIRVFSLSDWTILVALLFSAGNSAGSILEVTKGSTGRHFETVTPEQFVNGAKSGYFTTLSYIASLVAVKLSILFLYLRILSQCSTHRVCYVAIAVVGVLGLWSLLSSVLMCIPVSANWDLVAREHARCFSGPAKWGSDIAIHIFTELVVLVLPVRFVYSLTMPALHKVGLYGLFAFGIIVCIISLIRIPSIVAISHSKDPTWDSAKVAVWSCIELNIAIICACCMTLKPLISRIMPARLWSSFCQYRRQSDDEFPSSSHDRYFFQRHYDVPLSVATVGTRKERHIADPLDLDTIDKMPDEPPRVWVRSESSDVISSSSGS